MTTFAQGRQLEEAQKCVYVCVEQVEPSGPRPFSQPAGQMRPAPVAPPSGGVSTAPTRHVWKSMHTSSFTFLVYLGLSATLLFL